MSDTGTIVAPDPTGTSPVMRQEYVFDATSGLVAPAVQCPSPNFDRRPPGCRVELIVIHSISLPPGEYGTRCVSDFFLNRLDHDAHPYFDQIRELTVSSHLLIERDGALTQFVSINDRAWHAGQSEFCGRIRCNDFSVGIELEGTDDTPYEDSQYDCLNAVIQALRRAYPSLRDAPVVGHSDIAPGRKTDPGPGFDWARLAVDPG